MTTVDVMIVGAQKSGTSSLLRYLGDHPGIQPQCRREMTWFTDAPARRSASESGAEPFPGDLYFGQPDGEDQLRLGKLAGLMYSAEGRDRLAEHNPAVTAIVLLREPVSRAYAAFWLARRRGRESQPDFEQAIATGPPEGGYLDWSCYAAFVERLQETLTRHSVHVLILEELVGDPRAAVAPILAAVDLDAEPLSAQLPRENPAGAVRSELLARGRRRGGRVAVAKRLLGPETREALRRGYRRLNEKERSVPPIDPVVKRRLQEYFAGPNRRLEDLLGRPIEVWRP